MRGHCPFGTGQLLDLTSVASGSKWLGAEVELVPANDCSRCIAGIQCENWNDSSGHEADIDLEFTTVRKGR